MNKYLYLSAIFLFTNLLPDAAAAQLTDHSIQLATWFSTQGTVNQLIFSTDVSYDHVFVKRLDMTHALTTTIYSGTDELLTVPNQCGAAEIIQSIEPPAESR